MFNLTQVFILNSKSSFGVSPGAQLETGLGGVTGRLHWRKYPGGMLSHTPGISVGVAGTAGPGLVGNVIGTNYGLHNQNEVGSRPK